MIDASVESFRARIYHVPADPVVHLQCAWCLTLSNDTEPGMSREAVTALRDRMEARGWITATPADDEPETWRNAADYCSAACARREGESGMERAIRDERATRCDAHVTNWWASNDCADCQKRRAT